MFLFHRVELKLQLSVKMNRPAPVEITYECMRFLITHNPTNSQLAKFTEVRLTMEVVDMNSNIISRVEAEYLFFL